MQIIQLSNSTIVSSALITKHILMRVFKRPDKTAIKNATRLNAQFTHHSPLRLGYFFFTESGAGSAEPDMAATGGGGRRAERRRRGNMAMAAEANMRRVPTSTRPSHHAPTHRGSLGVTGGSTLRSAYSRVHTEPRMKPSAGPRIRTPIVIAISKTRERCILVDISLNFLRYFAQLILEFS
jgi:hypothetical protein